MADLFGVETPTPSPVHVVLRAYDDGYRVRFNVPAPISGGKDARLAKQLLAKYELERLLAWLRLFFTTRDTFIENSGYTFGVFAACIGKLIATEARIQKLTRAVNASTTPREIAHALAVHEQIKADDIAMAKERLDEYYRTHPWLTRSTPTSGR